MTASKSPLTILVVDDHEAVLNGTLSALQKEYSDASIRKATTAQATKAVLSDALPDVLVVDLALPEQSGDTAEVETGINLLRHLLATYPNLNIVVQSANVKSLVRLKSAIDTHHAGFTIADKQLPMKEMLIKVEWALMGVVYTPPDMRDGLEVRPEWLEVLNLAFKEGLQDKAIAKRMSVSERTVRNYWTNVQNALNIYPEAGKNSRIQTEIRSREEGLLD